MTVVKRVQLEITIHAPRDEVAEVMLSPESYGEWTSSFIEGARFEGSWDEGSRIVFLDPNGDGMVAEIAEHRPGEFLSIRHLGEIRQGVEDTESEAVRAWAPAYENYTFESVPEGTRLVVDQDVLEEYEDFMREAWVKALEALKGICEAR